MATKKDEKTVEQEPAAAPAIIAQRDTMTCFGVTLGEMFDGLKLEQQTIQIAHEETVSAKNAEINRLTQELADKTKALTHTKTAYDDAVIKMAVMELPGLRRHPDGSVSLRIKVPVEIAIPFLSQAEDAKEAPEIYIQRQLDEALLAYSMS